MRPVPVLTFKRDNLPGEVFVSMAELGLAAALDARDQINRAVGELGRANIILATGNSQLSFLHALREMEGIRWSKVMVFHMDNYIGLNTDHRASFPLFLRRHLLEAVKPGGFFPVSGDAADVEAACREYETLLRAHPADLVALGYGENGHLAFNDPPQARFFEPHWVRVVNLAEESRRQQFQEGHFDTLEEVPAQAITLTIPALLQARQILCIVPEARKAKAVHACLTLPVSEEHPGSILRAVNNAHIYLDVDSAARLRPDGLV